MGGLQGACSLITDLSVIKTKELFVKTPVFIISKNGKPLMPSYKFGMVRHFLKDGNAIVINKFPFTVKLTFETTEFVQQVNAGCDAGSRHIGFSVSDSKREFVSVQIDERRDIKSLLKSKRELRRTRRNRKRYRKARFDNRVSTKKKGWLPPSVRHIKDTHKRIIRMFSDILPISRLYVEIGDFDIRKLKDPTVSGTGYQQSDILGYENKKKFVKHRDNYKCQHCKGKSGNNKLEVHHIIHRNDGGTDDTNNLITLCHECHTMHHKEKMKLKLPSKKTLTKRDMINLRDAAAMNVMKEQLIEELKNEFPGIKVSKTYGYITAYNRIKYDVHKTHYNDAFVIAKNFNATVTEDVMYGCCVRRHNRQIHKMNILKGGRLKRNQTPHLVFGFAINDVVEYDNRLWFVTSRRKSGYFKITDITTKEKIDSISYNKLKFKRHSKRILLTKIKRNAAS